MERETQLMKLIYGYLLVLNNKIEAQEAGDKYQVLLNNVRLSEIKNQIKGLNLML